ncbi:MAG: 4Fe-4S dicluster domain-containing protein [Saprospiraceae bacterium]|nr:4Fe-4S dicluster domain-containing protein [Saprospiraceae bacterium]
MRRNIRPGACQCFEAGHVQSIRSRRTSSKRLHEVMDLCISCKACKSECPSNVDMAKNEVGCSTALL